MTLRRIFQPALVAGLTLLCCLVPVGASADWPMLGANPQRTSSVADEVRGNLGAIWYRPIEPYINYKTQVIAAAGKLFISTARGLYALDAGSGAVAWVYPTEVPLGHSPTYANGRVYVGSYDRTIHAIDATTGRRVTGWVPYVALAGFETNPLVVGGRVYAGNRDGYFYCLDATTGALIWRFKTGAPIRNSAAMDAQNTIYFAAEDLHGYALRDVGATYQLVWKSAKMLGDTFATYWPVIFRNWVIWSGSAGYFGTPPYAQGTQLSWEDKNDINANLAPAGSAAGDWPAGTVTLDASPILQYYESKPHRRRVFMMNRSTGAEYTFDTDGDGRAEYAPFTWTGVTQSGAKYPPIVGNDGVLYTDVNTSATAGMWTPAGALVGWTPGTRYVSRVMEWNKTEQAADEPMAFSAGGRLAYWSLCCDREAGSFDLTIPFGQSNRWWLYWQYNGRFSLFPNYEPMYHADDMDGWGVYGSEQGVYGKHGAQNPWVPYNGRIYRIMGNAVVAMGPGGGATTPLTIAATVPVQDAPVLPSVGDIRARLDEEILKMVSAGHLKPGVFRSNIGDGHLNGNGATEMDQGVFYFSSPGDTVYTLVRALPHLSTAVQAQARAYLQSEMTSFPLETYAYVGHVEGVARQAADIPPEFQAAFAAVGKQTGVVNNQPWRFPMIAFYAAWKYAQAYPADATRLYNALRTKITVPSLVSDQVFLSSTYALNAYLAGYRGHLELAKAAGQTEDPAVRNEYNRLLALRVNNFSVDAPWVGKVSGGFDYHRNFIYARHFLNLVPEIADELRKQKLAEVTAAVARINTLTPYWFVAGYDATHAEGTHQQLYDVETFNAYAMVLKAPYAELVKFLDAPAFPVGDLFYIRRLVAVIEAQATAPTAPRAPSGVRVTVP